MPSVIFVNRFFWPDHSATAQILSDVAAGLAARGMAVRVIASQTRYDDTSVRLCADDRWRGVTICRVPTTRFGRERLVGRAIDYLSFYASAWIETARSVRRGDVVVVKTDPPLLGVVLRSAARLRGARVINWLQDVYPELAAALGVRIAAGPLGRLLTIIRDRSLRLADATVVIGERMAERLAVADRRDRIRVIQNFTDETEIAPRPRDSELRAAWGIDPADFVIGYSGNLGRAHDLDTILKAARILQCTADEGWRFLFIGGGHLRARLREEVARRSLTSVILQPYQQRDNLPRSMSIPDVHWLSLHPDLEGLIVPSKFFAAAASGRPILFIGDREGEIARIIRANGAGYVVEPGDCKAVVTALRELRRSPALHADMGAAARRLIETSYRREEAIEQWHRLINSIGQVGSRDAFTAVIPS